MSERTPAVCVAVASRNRPVRLRWLLNALYAQTLAPAQLEVIVAGDPSSEETEQTLRTHPLAEQGRLRQVSFPGHSTLPGAGRNAAWRAARAPLILFTDDDCRPDVRWAERAIAAAQRSPTALLQGATLPDPEETAVLLGAPWARTVLTDPPTPWAETCNIAYPRRLLEQLGGFDEHMRVGEDTDLALRAQSHGARISAVPEMLVYHAVEGPCLPQTLLACARWRDLALLAKRHPSVRRHMWGAIWWKPEHAALCAALMTPALSRRHRALAALALPWLVMSMRHRGYGPRGIARSLTELPGRAAIDSAEILALARGSLRYRTLLL